MHARAISEAHDQGPGVKFSSNPDNLGEVTGGCIDSVTINGNPAAVIGSTVTTCDDMGQMDQCTIMSIGTVVTFPIQYPGQDPEQYRRDGGLPIRVDSPAVYHGAEVYRDQTKSLTNLQWSSGEIPRGDEVTLSCSSSGVRDGAVVTFSVYPDGANPETDPPLMDIRGTNEGSSSSVKWMARDIRKPESENPMKWFFTAWTMYCPKETSGLIEVTRVLPEFSELKWELVAFDEEGNEESRDEVSEIEHGLTACLSATVENMEDGENLHVLIYEDGYEDLNTPLTRHLVEIQDGKVTLEWPVAVSKEKLEGLTGEDELKFVFALQTLGDFRSEDSAAIQAVFSFRHYLREEDDKEGTFSMISTDDDGSAYNQQLTADADGIAEEDRIRLDFTDLKPGHDYVLVFKSSRDNSVKTVRRSSSFIQWVD